jgi:hypothetical protein
MKKMIFLCGMLVFLLGINPVHAQTQISVSQDENKIAMEILRYLESHPQAAETLEGIEAWWLSSHRSTSKKQVSVIRSIVERLVKDGKLTPHKVQNGRTYYSIHRPK